MTTDWISYSKPPHISQVWKDVILELERIDSKVGELFPDLKGREKSYGIPSSNTLSGKTLDFRPFLIYS